MGKQATRVEIVSIKDIKENQKNPRIIRDKKFSDLVKSIKDFPEMLEAREIVVNTDMVILGGNMRHKACIEAGIEKVPVKIVDWTQEKQDEFVIKDNVSGGEWDWDELANDWDNELLEDWGVTGVHGDFKPKFNPDSTFSTTSEDDMGKAPAKMQKDFDGNGNAKTTVLCPFCDEEFMVNE